jgi:hypothetical protein
MPSAHCASRVFMKDLWIRFVGVSSEGPKELF